MKVLVINCGSSSLKYQLIDSVTEVALAVGLCERIGIDGRLNHTPNGGEKVVIEQAMPDHEVAIRMVLDALTNENYGVIKNLDEIDAIGHRLVHGGEKFTKSVIIDDEVIAGVEECSPLAPLHNPANLIGVRACQAIMPACQTSVYLILPFIRLWNRLLICTVFHMSIMKNIKYVVTASTEQATALFPNVRFRC